MAKETKSVHKPWPCIRRHWTTQIDHTCPNAQSNDTNTLEKKTPRKQLSFKTVDPPKDYARVWTNIED